MIILKIAFRNLWEHKVKSLIVGILIAFGSFILVAGNSFLDSINSGMHQSYSANFTGDLIIHGKAKDSFSMIPGKPIEGGTPIIPNYPMVQSKVDSMPEVSQSLPLIGGMASIALDENSVGFSMLWAADFQKYQAMFPDNLEMISGDWPTETQGTIIMSAKVHESAEQEAKRSINIGDKILLTGATAGGTKIREVRLAGIFRFKRGGEILDMISLVDPDTLRTLNHLTSFTPPAPAAEIDPSTSQANTAMNEDALFGGDSITKIATPTATASNFDTILGDTSQRAKYAATDPNAWNFLLLRLKTPADAPQIALSLNNWAAAQNLEMESSDWQWGAGQQAQLVNYLQTLFLIIVLILIVVVVIIIMNTLVISISERIPEIGTMRAIGAPKNFVRQMVFTETLIISVVFGIIGLICGSVAIGVLHVTGVEASNQFLSILFGGAALHPGVSLWAVLSSLSSVVIIGLAACVYPIAIALKISPVRAMQR